jgi:hypothetical protein
MRVIFAFIGVGLVPGSPSGATEPSAAPPGGLRYRPTVVPPLGEQAEKFLDSQKKMRIENDWNQGRSLEKIPRNLYGCFIGKGLVNPPADTWKVQMSFAESGSFVSIRSPDLDFKRQKLSGTLDDLREVSSGKPFLLLAASEEILFQLFFESPKWMGNIYRRSEPGGPYSHTGRLNLVPATGCNSAEENQSASVR